MTELVYGINPVQSVLDINPKQIVQIYIIYRPWNYRLQILFNQIKKYNISFRECSKQSLTVQVKSTTHQGIIARIQKVVCLKENYLLNFLETYKKTPLLLILDGVTDSHNLGACLRSADAAGVDLVIVPKNRALHINAVVRKTSSGASERIPFVQVTNLSRTLQLLKKHNIYIIGTIIQPTQALFEINLNKALGIVIGSEETGIRQLTKKNCDKLVTIPMIKSDISLNVSVATGICLFEVLRQRKYQK